MNELEPSDDETHENSSNASSVFAPASIHDSAGLLDWSGDASEVKNVSGAAAGDTEIASHRFADSIPEQDEVGGSVASDENYSDSEDEDEDDDEPALKYEKLGGAAQELLAKDTASALNVSLRLMASIAQCR